MLMLFCLQNVLQVALDVLKDLRGNNESGLYLPQNDNSLS